MDQSDLESWFTLKTQPGPSIKSGCIYCVGLQMVSQFAHVFKGCWTSPKRVSQR